MRWRRGKKGVEGGGGEGGRERFSVDRWLMAIDIGIYPSLSLWAEDQQMHISSRETR